MTRTTQKTIDASSALAVLKDVKIMCHMLNDIVPENAPDLNPQQLRQTTFYKYHRGQNKNTPVLAPGVFLSISEPELFVDG